MTGRRQERVEFPATGGSRLVARIDRPELAPRAWALFAHCFTCSKDLKAAGWITNALADRGFGVMRFDFTGLGESEGEFADTDFGTNLDDLVSAAGFMRTEYRAPQLLIGHSLGGAAVLAAAARIPESIAVATIGAPSDTGHLSRTLLAQAPELQDQDEAEVRLGGRPFRVKRQLIEDLDARNLNPSIADLGRALLVMHSPVDDVVGIDHARRIYDAAKHPKSFVSLDGADHLLLKDPRDARWVAEVLAAWAERYLPPSTEAEPGAEAAVPTEPGEVIVRGDSMGLAQELLVGRHRLAADEPESVGGTDTGPTPYGYLLAALGSCTNMTLRLYADRKGLPLEGVETVLRHDRIHARDCEDCESTEGLVDRIEREIALRGPLDPDQRRRLLEIADRCPVHRTLTREIRIETRESGDPGR